MPDIDYLLARAVAVISFANPPGLSHAVRAGISAALERAQPDPAVRAIVLTGPVVSSPAAPTSGSSARRRARRSPGYGFSGKPQAPGWGPDRIARACAVLMGRLGYKRYVAQGGDWGSVVADVMACQAPAGLLGIHINMPATVPADVAKALQDGDPAPHSAMMVTRPQTLGVRAGGFACRPGCVDV